MLQKNKKRAQTLVAPLISAYTVTIKLIFIVIFDKKMLMFTDFYVNISIFCLTSLILYVRVLYMNGGFL